MSRAAGPSGLALAGVLIGHIVLGFAWLVVFLAAAFLTSSYTGWADVIIVLGGLCWLVAFPIIVMGWRSGSRWFWGVPVAWVTVVTIATLVVPWGSWESSAEAGPPPPGTDCPTRSARPQGGEPQAGGPSGAAPQIAFVSDRDGDFQIYVMNADGSDQRRLTRNATGGLAPAWSPDGTEIAFTKQAAGTTRTTRSSS